MLGNLKSMSHSNGVCLLCVQDRYEVLTKQFANAGIKGLTDIITPANKDLSRWVLLEQGTLLLSAH
jgi:hypothetical protein